MGDSVFLSLHIIIEMLNLHVISSSWDMQVDRESTTISYNPLSQMLKSLAASSRAKTQRVVLDGGDHCSVTGKLFVDTINVSKLGNKTYKLKLNLTEPCSPEQQMFARRPERHSE